MDEDEVVLKEIIEHLKYCSYNNKEVDTGLYYDIKEYIGLADNIPAECEDDNVLLSYFSKAKSLFLEAKVSNLSLH